MTSTIHPFLQMGAYPHPVACWLQVASFQGICMTETRFERIHLDGLHFYVR